MPHEESRLAQSSEAPLLVMRPARQRVVVVEMMSKRPERVISTSANGVVAVAGRLV